MFLHWNKILFFQNSTLNLIVKDQKLAILIILVVIKRPNIPNTRKHILNNTRKNFLPKTWNKCLPKTRKNRLPLKMIIVQRIGKKNQIFNVSAFSERGYLFRIVKHVSSWWKMIKTKEQYLKLGHLKSGTIASIFHSTTCWVNIIVYLSVIWLIRC